MEYFLHGYSFFTKTIIALGWIFFFFCLVFQISVVFSSNVPELLLHVYWCFALLKPSNSISLLPSAWDPVGALGPLLNLEHLLSGFTMKLHFIFPHYPILPFLIQCLSHLVNFLFHKSTTSRSFLWKKDWEVCTLVSSLSVETLFLHLVDTMVK